jgi:hypothetical protein
MRYSRHQFRPEGSFHNRVGSLAGRIRRYREAVFVTTIRCSSLGCQKNNAGELRIGAGKTKRIGGRSWVREMSSTINPAWMTRRRIVPVTSEWKTTESRACSTGGSDSVGGGGSGAFRREVWIEIEVARVDGKRAETWVETSTPPSIA